MRNGGLRTWLKAGLGRLPYTAEAYQRLLGDGKVPAGGYALDRLASQLEVWVETAEVVRSAAGKLPGRRVAVFAYLQWWLEHAVALSLLLHANGHEVEFWYLPYRRWQVDTTAFDDRRQIAYMTKLLGPMAAEIQLRPLLDRSAPPPELAQEIEQQSLLDVQYTLQREQIEWSSDSHARALLDLRRRRNSRAAAAAFESLRQRAVDVLIVPNGSILEFGTVYRTARHLGVTTVTYEFGEQRERMWLAQNAEVMRLPTGQLWNERGSRPASRAQLEQVAELYRARRGGKSWSRFAREWQRADRSGAEAVMARLGLSPELPVVLLCTNVVGDSLALDRQVFTRGMADWLAETVRYFSTRDDAQLVVRVHPGELLGAGHPSVQIVRQSIGDLSDRVTVVGPESELNTYDLIEAASFGLVYTSTVGLEMAMYGVPVIVSGATHYRGRGFTVDPPGLGQYFGEIDTLLKRSLGGGLSQEQVELAWRYAYLFFFDYPFPYPWHLIGFWQDLELRPFAEVVQEGLKGYQRTLEALAGEPIDWALRSVPEAVQA